MDTRFIRRCGVSVCVLVAAVGFSCQSSSYPLERLRNPVYLGASIDIGEATVEKNHAFERQIGKKIAQAVWFLGWDQPFPTEACRSLWDSGVVPHVTWEPLFWKNDGKIALNDISGGRYDRYIDEWAKDVVSYGGPLFLRLMHECNGNWYDWSLDRNGRDALSYVRAWRHVHERFVRAGAKNVQFVWAVAQTSLPDEPWNDPLTAYPGDDVVDWIGIDAYNWGRMYDWSRWTDFEGIVGPMYRRLSAAIANKPFMVAETSSTDNGGDKGAFVASIPAALNAFERIRSVVWFEVVKESDWRVASSGGSLAAFRAWASDPNVLESGQGLWDAGKK